MAKGLIDYEDRHALGTVGLQARDYEMAGFDDADLVIAIGYDLVEHAPEHSEPERRDKKIVVIDSVAAEIDEFFLSVVELIGDIAHVVALLAAGCSPRSMTSQETGSVAQRGHGRPGGGPSRRPLPAPPGPLVLWDIRAALRPEDLLVEYVGLH